MSLSFPTDFIAQMETLLGTEAPSFFAAHQASPPVSIRFNPEKNFSWRENSGKVKWNANGVYLHKRPVFTLDPAFHAGAYYVQEASSMFVGEALRQSLDMSRPLRMLDLCAAPGGKSTLLADLAGPESFLLANEAIKSRYQPLRHNLIKWGKTNTLSSNLDPAGFSRLNSFFDLVLVDAPCSGEGLFRRDPTAMQEWSKEQVTFCAARQKRILTQAFELVKPGGVLLYCTCTFNELENSGNGRWLEQTLPLQQIDLRVPEEWGIVKKDYGLQFYPHRLRGEGFFIAGFRKTEGEAYLLPKIKGFAGLEALSKKELSLIRSWVKQDADLTFFRNRPGKIITLPGLLLGEYLQMDRALRRTDMGINIGEIKGKDFIPSPALAYSAVISREVPRLSLDRGQALNYLKKETFAVPTAATGWALVEFEGLPLGWAKILKNRVNNYFPRDWRIRMDLKKGYSTE